MKIAHLFAAALLGLAGATPAEAQGSGDVRFGVQIGRGGLDVRFEGRTRDRHVRRSDAPQPVWVPGRWEFCEERYQEPGRWHQVWVEPVYEWRVDPCGRRYQVCVRPGHYESRWCEGRWATRQVRRWVPGYWSQGEPVCPPPAPQPIGCPDRPVPPPTHGDVAYRR
ncbi:MAG: hypothetical protein IPN34_21545 [Planctomycetes bacterium]|nr:hypothetical protein [Planctomycetota bacterium]